MIVKLLENSDLWPTPPTRKADITNWKKSSKEIVKILPKGNSRISS